MHIIKGKKHDKGNPDQEQTQFTYQNIWKKNSS